MNIPKGSMLYFAENDYMFLNDILHPERHKDRSLLMCEQCVEKYMKHILKNELQEINSTHNITYIHKRVCEVIPELKAYVDCIRFLRECYFDRNYENDVYFELTDAEFDFEFNRALDLISILRDHIFKDIKRTSLFTK